MTSSLNWGPMSHSFPQVLLAFMSRDDSLKAVFDVVYSHQNWAWLMSIRLPWTRPTLAVVTYTSLTNWSTTHSETFHIFLAFYHIMEDVRPSLPFLFFSAALL
jgi:hypothetical protein